MLVVTPTKIKRISDTEAPQAPLPKAPRIENDLNLHTWILHGQHQKILDHLQRLDPQRVKQIPVLGPQQKTQETCIIEQLTKELLVDFNKYQIVKQNSSFFVIVNGTYLTYPTDHARKGEPIELSELIRNSNFNHIEFSAADRKLFEQFFTKTDATRFTFDDVACSKLSPYSLSLIERHVLNLYTQSEHTISLRFIEGRLNDLSEYSLDRFKVFLLLTTLQVSALNKIPDKEELLHPAFFYRSESSRLPEHVLNERIRAVEKGGLVTTQGFMSTSIGWPCTKFSDRKVYTLFEISKGKSISGLSRCPEEYEVLIPPTQVQWLYHHQYFHKGEEKHVFIARAVTTPIDTSTMAENAPPLVELPVFPAKKEKKTSAP